MVDVAKVKMFGLNVGTFSWDGRYEVSRFEYDPDFVNKRLEPSPLMMPVRPGRLYSFGSLDKDTFKGLPGMLADSLPDTYGRALFDRWLALIGRTSSNSIETLCFLGDRCMGALEFEPALNESYGIDKNIEIDSLIEVAKEALSEKKAFAVNINDDRKAAIADILRLGTSAGGQRAKAIIAYNKKTGEVRSGQVDLPEGFDYYMIKLDGVSANAGFKETENFGDISAYITNTNQSMLADGNNIIQQSGKGNNITQQADGNTVNRFISLLEKKDEQIDRLLTIIEKLNK